MSIVYNGAPDARLFKELLGETIREIAEADEDIIYLDADLMSCIGMKKWADAHPDRAINCGVAEANMMGVACGLALAGFRPIAHTFGPFASRRSFDQVFLSGGYAGNDITVIGTDPGVCATFNGGTHMPFEDVALYSALPGATVVDISDAAMLAGVLPQLPYRGGVKYLRVGRKANPRIYDGSERFELGKGKLLRPGADVALIACGIMVAKALAAAEALAGEGIDAAVVDMFTIKPLDEALTLELAARCGAIVTCENHNRAGGLFAAVAGLCAGQAPVPIERVAVEDEFGEVGPQDYLEERFGLTVDHIIKRARKAVARKARS